ncbi:hypothetical protein FB45DRAFT_1054990 [Roridomyces roridus]|uniref:Uncharacterized protein n=1 Tax=Roridomyces roridus TaxID=1738132 RepID=A0AAD7FRH5_9AGAR|nr:hypothetical protein FB45DRAFT_1054990 [Roridomyces roridus]
MNDQLLTTERLPGLPKLDKNQFISSYIQSQKANAKAYAEEGRTFVTSWNSNTTPKKAAPAPANVGFATPVLIARPPRVVVEEVPRKEDAEPVEKPPKKSSSKPSTKTVEKPVAEKLPLSKKSSGKTTATKNTDKSLSKKRVIEPEQDEDEAARLLERRERKRAKRAIVQPKEPSEAETASSGKPKKKSKTAKEKKSKVPAGFALMHGFSARNVGKNRLTLKPPSNVGVFKKGKASLNTKTKQKPKQRHGGKPFSELGFLRNAKKAPVSDTSSDPDNDSVSTSVAEAKKKRKKPMPCTTSQHPSELSKPSTSSPPKVRAPAESIIWDIESNASQNLKSTKEGKPSQDEGTVFQGTVVLDARIPAWGQQDSAVESAPAIPSSPSLRPSQSASQVGQHLQAPAPEASSRYFQIHVTAPPVKPQPEQPSKPASSVAPDPKLAETCHRTELPDVPDCPIRFSVATRTRVLADQFPPVPSLPTYHEDPYPYLPETIEDYEESERYTPAPDEFLIHDYQSDCSPDDGAPLWVDEPLMDHIDCNVPVTWEDNWDDCQGFEEEYEDACCEEAVEAMEDIDSAVYQDDDLYEDIYMAPVGEVVTEEVWDEAPVYLEGEASPFDLQYLEVMEDTSSCSDGADEARFSQGRALLLGLPIPDSRSSHPPVHISRAEQDVAKGLRHHWRPHRL